MPEVSEVEVVRGQQAASASASASADNHNNQNVNTTNSEPQHQQIVVVTTTNGDDGRVDMEAAAEEATHVEAGVEDPVEGQRTVIVHEEVLKQEVEYEENGISSFETSDAVASVLPDQTDVNMMEFVGEQVVGEEEVVTAGEEVIGGEEVVINGADGEKVVFVTSSGEVAEIPSSGPVGGDASGGVGGDFFVQDSSEVNGGEVIQMQEEEIIETPSSETEMSVAMEMAKLSQGDHGGGGTIYTSPSGTHFQEEVYGNGFSDRENTTPPPSSRSTNIILPPTANVSGNRRRSSTGTSANSGPPPVLGADGTEKPRMSYAQLIAEALMSTEDRMLPLAEIYQAINKRYPYYRMDVKSWQNAIRHNLTLNPSFTKIPRPNNEGRGNYWKMEEGSEKTIFRRQIRAAQNRSLMEEKSRAAAAAKQQRQQRQQQLLQQRRQVQVQQQPQQRPQQVTYQVVTQTPGGQTVLSPAPTGPTRYICVRPSGVQTTPAVGTVIARPTIQLVSPTRNASTIQIVSSGNAASGGIRIASASPASTTMPSNTTGPRIMKIKDTIVRQNGSVVFIAMPSNASAVKPPPPVSNAKKAEEESAEGKEDFDATVTAKEGEEEQAVVEEAPIEAFKEEVIVGDNN